MTRLLALPLRLVWAPLAAFLRLLGFGAGLGRRPVVDPRFRLWQEIDERRASDPDAAERSRSAHRWAVSPLPGLRASYGRALVPAAIIIALVAAVGSYAYFTAGGSGNATANAGTLSAPAITSATPGAGTVDLTWSVVTPPVGVGGVTYYVSSDSGAPTSTCPMSGLPLNVLTCQESGLSAGTYHYTVTAKWRSWTATSPTSTVVVAFGALDHFLLHAATTTLTAGVGDDLTITAKDAANITVTTYAGDHSLTFGGASTIGSFHPTVTDKTGATVDFGTPETITFTDGVATIVPSTTDNGVMTLYKAEAATITVTDGSISNTGLNVTVSEDVASKLAFSVSPSDTSADDPLSPQPQVTVEDQFGNTVTGDGSSVTVAIKAGTGAVGASLSSCVANPKAALSGVATFVGCQITKVGTGYQLHATDGSLSAADSSAFDITPGAANKLVFSTVPSGNQTATSTATIGPYQVQEQDQFGNPVTAGSTVTVTLSSNSAGTKFFSLTSGGAIGIATTTVNIAGGQSTSANFYYSDTKAGSPTLTAHNAGITNDATTSPTILAAGAAALCIDSASTCTGATDNHTKNTTYSSTVSLIDAFGNLVAAGSSISVSVSWSGDATGSASLTINAGSTTTSASFSINLPNGNNKNVNITASHTAPPTLTAATQTVHTIN
jgi:hypothetical protein